MTDTTTALTERERDDLFDASGHTMSGLGWSTLLTVVDRIVAERVAAALAENATTPEPVSTVHFTACHLVNPSESLNTCTACGGSTLLDPPCQPARDVPLLLAPAPTSGHDDRECGYDMGEGDTCLLAAGHKGQHS